MPSVMQMTRGSCAAVASKIAVGGKRGRHKNDTHICARLLDCFLDGVKYRKTIYRRSAFTGGDSADDVGAVVAAALGMEEAFAAGDALNDEAGVFIN